MAMVTFIGQLYMSSEVNWDLRGDGEATRLLTYNMQRAQPPVSTSLRPNTDARGLRGIPCTSGPRALLNVGKVWNLYTSLQLT